MLAVVHSQRVIFNQTVSNITSPKKQLLCYQVTLPIITQIKIVHVDYVSVAADEILVRYEEIIAKDEAKKNVNSAKAKKVHSITSTLHKHSLMVMFSENFLKNNLRKVYGPRKRCNLQKL